tara:strand:+ start:126 stop:365 length:240 start_codon:yes stop_codon:yes gene_type:complete
LKPKPYFSLLYPFGIEKTGINKLSTFTRRSQRYPDNFVLSPFTLFRIENVRTFGNKENPIFGKRRKIKYSLKDRMKRRE